MGSEMCIRDRLRALTSRKATTIKLSTSVRTTLGPAERADEIEKWWSRIHDDDFDKWWSEQVQEAIYRTAVDATLANSDLTKNSELHTHATEIQRDAALAHLLAIESSHVWRATAWYRHLRSGFSR